MSSDAFIKNNNQVSTEIAGENSLIVYFSDTASTNEQSSFPVDGLSAISAKVQQMTVLLEQHLGSQLVDLVPSYASLLVLFDRQLTDHEAVANIIFGCALELNSNEAAVGKLVELPVYYGLEGGGEDCGPDLARVASLTKLSPEQVVQIHQQQEYRVYAIGFAPGFAYLGEVDSRIATPRLATPRLQVPAGAVAIADRQTAVYPADSPGGWNLIGLCPAQMFDPLALNANDRQVMPVSVGDRVRFRGINKSEFLQLGGMLNGSSRGNQ